MPPAASVVLVLADCWAQLVNPVTVRAASARTASGCFQRIILFLGCVLVDAPCVPGRQPASETVNNQMRTDCLRQSRNVGPHVENDAQIVWDEYFFGRAGTQHGAVV